MTLPNWKSSEVQSLTGTAWTVATPVGANVGDLIVVVFRANAGLGVQNLTAPAGWVQVYDSDERGSIRGNGWMEAWYYVLPASPPATHGFTGSTSRVGTAHTHVFEAGTFDAAAPVETYAYDEVPSAVTTAFPIPAVTVAGDAMLLATAGTSGSTPTWTPDTNYTERTDNSTSNMGTGSGTRAVTAGTYSATWTASVSDNGMVSHIAIKGATGGGPVDQSGTDTGAGSEAVTLSASADATDTGAGVDAVALDATTPLSATDTGAGADAVFVDVAIAATEGGAGAEAATLSASAVLVEAGAGDDQPGAGSPVDLVEAGSGADALVVDQGAAIAETGSGDDGTAFLDTAASVGDSGTSADSAALSYAEWILQEVGAGADLGGLLATLGITDSGAGTNENIDTFLGALFNVTIGGVTRTSYIDIDTFRVEESAGRMVASFTLTDKAGLLGSPLDLEVVVTMQGTPVFGGFIRDVQPRLTGPTLHYDCKAVDYSTLLDEDAIPDPTYRTATESDAARVAWMVSTYGTKGIVAGSFVQTIAASMPGGTDNRPEQDFGAKTLREGLAQIARVVGAGMYVDASKQLHWYPLATGEGLAAPFDLADTATPGAVPVFGLDMPIESTSFRNAVFIRGAGVRGWYPNPPPSASFRRAGVIRSDEITTQAQLDAAGAAYVADHPLSRSAKMTILSVGLHPGMSVNLTASRYGLAPEDWFVNSIQYQLANRATPVFEVTLGRTAPSLADLFGGVADTAAQAQDTATGTADDLGNVEAGGGNLVANSSFENAATTGWAIGAGWTFGFAVADAKDGAKVARLVRSAAAAGDLNPDFIPVDRSRQYTFSFWSFLRSRSSGTARCELREYNAAGTLLATTTIVDLVAAQTGWVRHSKKFGAADAAGVRAFNTATTKVRMVWRTATTATLTWDIDAVQAEDGEIATAYTPLPTEIPDFSVGSPQIIPGSIDDVAIADGSITAPKIQDAAVTSQKIADAAINTAKFAQSIRPVEIIAGALPTLPSGNYPQGAVVFKTSDNKLYRSTGTAWTAVVATADLSGQVTSTQIADNAITTPKLNAGAVTANELAANSVVAGKIAAGAISATEIAAGAISTSKLAAGAVTANELAANSVIAGKVAANAITATAIAAGAITTTKLAANAVTTNELAANSVTAAELAAGAVTATKIAAGAITTDKLLAGQVAIKNGAGQVILDPNAEAMQIWGAWNISMTFINAAGTTTVRVNLTGWPQSYPPFIVGMVNVGGGKSVLMPYTQYNITSGVFNTFFYAYATNSFIEVVRVTRVAIAAVSFRVLALIQGAVNG